jgi:hypothetical protein
MKKVLFLHGLESRPGGQKPRYLKQKGYRVFNPALPKSSFEESIRIAQGVVDEECPDVIVGSSRGGAIAMCINPRGAKLVLIAAAWKRFGGSIHEGKVQSDCVIIHSDWDKIVDIEDSIALANQTGGPLLTVGKCHRMNDSDALEGMLDAVEWVTK